MSWLLPSILQAVATMLGAIGGARPHSSGLVVGRGHHPRAVGAERRAVDATLVLQGLPIGAPVAASHTRAVLSRTRSPPARRRG